MIPAGKILLKEEQRERLFYWGRLISLTGGAQIIIQIFGLISGVMIVRMLPIQEYAFYTLANTMLGTMTVLSDGGITVGVISEGGKVWQDKNKLGAVMATGLILRRSFAVISLAVSLPILIYLLFRQGADWIAITFILFMLIPSFLAAMSDSILEIPPKLHQQIKPLQVNQIIVSVLRTITTGGFLYILPGTAIALLANGLPRLIGNFQLAKISSRLADLNQPSDNKAKIEIVKVVKRILPGAIYFCFYGQITVWIISYFGNSSSLAEMGALGRVSTLLSLISVISSTIIVPRFARLETNKSEIHKFFVLVQLLIFGVCCLICLLTSIFSQPILLILGNSYSGLRFELLLLMISSCTNLISGLSFNLSSARGWILHPSILISSNIIAVIISANLFSISTLQGVLYFNIAISVVPLLLNSLFCYYKILKI